MKRTFVILTLFVCCFASRASDQMFYGPWWTTLLLSSGGAKDAGELTIAVFDVGNVAGTGIVALHATQSNGQNSGSVTTRTFHGSWTRSVLSPNVINISVDQPFIYDTRWTGKLNILKGTLNETLKSSLSKGRFQTTRNKTS
jgi:hypothetical protein